MKASIIIPCWNCADTLGRCLACVRAQTLSGFEAIFVDDGSTDATAEILSRASVADSRIRVVTFPENRGVSAARNAGLDLASGRFVFFADPDDEFRADLLEKGVAAMESEDADYCVFPHREKVRGESDFRYVPLKGTCRYASNEEIRRLHLTRMFGYSAAQVRAWYAGEDLFAHRMHGGVWCCVYRLELIRRHGVRFDERIRLYEDGMFNCEYMLRAQRMTSLEEPLYDYIRAPTGAVARLRRGDAELENKLELLRKRKELDVKGGGGLADSYACSCVFSLLEMLRIVLSDRVSSIRSGYRLICEYGSDDVVRTALSTFPLSFRHPLLALSVLVLRIRFCL